MHSTIGRNGWIAIMLCGALPGAVLGYGGLKLAQWIARVTTDPVLAWLDKVWPEKTAATPPDLTLVKGGADEIVH